jgi:hypothetical protein
MMVYSHHSVDGLAPPPPFLMGFCRALIYLSPYLYVLHYSHALFLSLEIMLQIWAELLIFVTNSPTVWGDPISWCIGSCRFRSSRWEDKPFPDCEWDESIRDITCWHGRYPHHWSAGTDPFQSKCKYRYRFVKARVAPKLKLKECPLEKTPNPNPNPKWGKSSSHK